MSVSFRILKSLGLVYVRYEGEARTADTLSAFGTYATHPDFRPGQKQFVDLSALTGWDDDYLSLMKAQAKKAEAFTGNNAQTLIVYYAPNPIGQKLAQLAMHSWEPFPAVVPIIQDNESQALSILGLPFENLQAMLTRAAE
ncbi:hypothetical protein [Shimia marina]|uniref:Uncharacterized protein n=1 Tax=Shimia marina TaxID=321267 RepID=A0A0P1ESG9_9RHOB|nr:hypothetical protein [Shimia marina]CUH53497.1 hypothetical protein SHM7688_02951 [Shimia marina]SFD75668.1 hypothetical protein SAMN04488037_102319 [Shimia marina]